MPARIDAELVRRGLARSREQAVALVAAGRVSVDGAVATKPAQRVAEASEVAVQPDPDDPGYASRAGHKLAAALAVLGDGPAVRGRRCLDVGSSTGGFTDVLLRGGARAVVCLDVGHDQLRGRLRDDPRTLVLEGRDVREVTVCDVGGPADLVVVDVSFISLLLVLPVLGRVAAPGADLLLLVKPQFEVGRAGLGRGGVVRDADRRREVLHRVARAADELGWGLRAATASPLPGPAGNVEYFLWLRRGPSTVPQVALDHAVTAGPGGERVSW